jgi:hypothetical protein
MHLATGTEEDNENLTACPVSDLDLTPEALEYKAGILPTDRDV